MSSLRISLRYKLMCLFIILAVIPLGFAGNSMIRRTRDEIKTIGQDSLISTADMIIRDIQSFRNDWLMLIQLMRKSIESQDVSLDGKLSLIKEALGGDQTDIVSIQISVEGVPSPLIIMDSKFIAGFDSSLSSPQDVFTVSHDEIRRELGNLSWFISDPFYVQEAGVWMVRIILPLSPNVFAMPATLTALADLSRFQQRIHSYHFHKIGIISLIAESGLMTQDISSAYVSAHQQNHNVWEKLETEGKILIETAIGMDGEIILGAYSFTQYPQIKIAVEMAQAKAYQSVREMEIFYFKWIGIGLAIAVAGALIVSVFLTSPLRRLTEAARKIANGNFNVEIKGQQGRDEIGDLSSAFIKMQMDLKQFIEQLQETTKAKERVESELELAKEIQQNFLPKTFPETSSLDIGGRCYPAREVGGDYFDCFQLDERRYGFVVGDVTGKGIPAALFMAVSRTLFRILCIDRHDPGQVLTEFNDRLVELDADANMFITLFYCIFDSQTGVFRYATAGHNMPFIKRAADPLQSFVMLPGLKTMVAGMINGIDMETAETALNPGDIIVIYTDGMTEAVNDLDEEFGEDQLAALLTQYKHLPAQQMCDQVIQHVMDFQGDQPQFDDITLFILKVNNPLSNTDTADSPVADTAAR